MPEIEITGANGLTFPSMTTWGWEIALYLFLGGMVAGLMIYSSAMRLYRPERFKRALLVGDLAALPLLTIGMLLLLFDLSNKLNVWRLYTTFQPRSAISWGAWMLLITLLVLAFRFVSRIPAPAFLSFAGLELFAPLPSNEEEARVALTKKPARVARVGEWMWKRLYAIGEWTWKRDRPLTVVGAVLGIGVGFYTGVLLSTLASRPLWNTAVLAPLFLVSGLGTGAAFLSLFLPHDERSRLIPFSILLCAVEIILLIAYVLNLTFGSGSAQRAGAVLFEGMFGTAFWGLVVIIGLIVPAIFEQLEVMQRRIPLVPARVLPVLKLVGGVTLRFVIVYAGLLSFV